MASVIDDLEPLVRPDLPDLAVVQVSRRELRALLTLAKDAAAPTAQPIPMRITCPACGALHIDEGEFETKPHHTHACQNCGNVWRPAIVATVGVRFLPGFKNPDPHDDYIAEAKRTTAELEKLAERLGK